MPTASEKTEKQLSQLVPESEQEDRKFDYLKAKYIFRYPFTFTSIKWALALGTFIGLHTFIRTRNPKKSFENLVWGSFWLTFPIWAFFKTKYEFYQSSIEQFEEEEENKIRKINMYKKYIEFKMKLPEDHQFSEEELMDQYTSFLRDNFDRNSELDCLLEGVDENTFDLKVV